MKKRERGDDPVTYRIEYSLIAQELHEASERGRKRKLPPAELGERPDAVSRAIEAAREPVGKRRDAAAATSTPKSVPGLSDRALELVEVTTRELRSIGWRWVGKAPPRYVKWARRRASPEDTHLGAFLDGVLEPAAVVLYWSCRVNDGEGDEVERVLEERKPAGTRRWLRRIDLSKWRSDWRRQRRNRRQIDRHLFARNWHRDGAWLEDYLLILASPHSRELPPIGRFFVKLGLTRIHPMPLPSYRVRYNLACLYARLADRRSAEDRRSLEHLEKASRQWDLCLSEATGVQRDAIRQWAHRDPALASLCREGRI